MSIIYRGLCGDELSVEGGRAGPCRKYQEPVDVTGLWASCRSCEFAKGAALKAAPSSTTANGVAAVAAVANGVATVAEVSGGIAPVNLLGSATMEEAAAPKAAAPTTSTGGSDSPASVGLPSMGGLPSMPEVEGVKGRVELSVGALNLVEGDDGRKPVPEILKEIGVAGGPSEGGISQHALQSFVVCPRRAYEAHVEGLVRNGSARPAWADEGDLFHATMYLHRSSGGRRTFEAIEAVRREGWTELAGKMETWVMTYLTKFAVEEAKTWDVRALEKNVIWWCDVWDVAGPLVREKLKGWIPVSGRFDVLVSIRDEGAPITPPGEPCPAGVWVNDEKTTSRLDAALIKHYSTSWQFRVYALLYRRALEASMGKFRGVIVSVMPKTRDPKPLRIYDEFDERKLADLDRWDRVTFRPLLARFVEMLLKDESWEEWPQYVGDACSGSGKYACHYNDICDYGVKMRDCYRRDPSRIIGLDWTVPAELMRERREEIAAEKKGIDLTEARTLKSEKAEARREERERVTEALVEVIGRRISSEGIEFEGRKTKEVVADIVPRLVEYGREGLKEEIEGAEVEWTDERVIWVGKVTRSRMKYDSLARKIVAFWSDPARMDVEPAEKEDEADED